MILSLVGGKGGGGKSTTAIAVACELAAHAKGPVALVDADPQQQTIVSWSGDVEMGRVAEIRLPNIYACTGNGLLPVLTKIVPEHEHVVVDTPGRVGELLKQALLVSDIALIPVAPSPADGRALAKSAELVREGASKRDPKAPPLKVVACVNRFSAPRDREKEAQKARARLKVVKGVQVLKTVVGARYVLVDMLATGEGVTTFAPRSEAAREVRALVAELLALAGERGRS